MNQLTPQITPLATEVINDPTMPAGLFQSYARLYAAAAAHDFQHTGPLDFDSQVVPLLGLRRSQVRQHLQALRFAKLLDWSTDGSNRYVFRFKSRFPDSVGDGVVDLEKSLPEEIQQQQQPSEKPEQDGVEQQVRGWLLRAGVWGDAAARLARQVAETSSGKAGASPGKAGRVRQAGARSRAGAGAPSRAGRRAGLDGVLLCGAREERHRPAGGGAGCQPERRAPLPAGIPPAAGVQQLRLHRGLLRVPGGASPRLPAGIPGAGPQHSQALHAHPAQPLGSVRELPRAAV